MKMTHPDTEVTMDVPDGSHAVYLSQGWRPATPEAPKGNAPLEEWQTFARAQGFSEDDLDGKTRADLRAALS